MLCNNPKNFRDEMICGYAAAFPQYVTPVPGGVAKSFTMPAGKVTVINGGGSGHYPAFCGIIGQGFMDATVVGNVFTSPSADDVYHVAKAVDNGAGIFIVGGNYAGDKMNFDIARDRLKEEGIDARTFYITDDIASAEPEEWQKRRGNVGTFMVFKAAGAAAEMGMTIDEVERLTSHCNDHVRTMSIGFRGCTLPGHHEPMFHVPAGKMEVGQGIHGEAGVYEDDRRSASEIAELLVERVLSEKPSQSGNRIAVILDGLGSTKYEELFVVWNTVSRLFTERGYILVEPQVGEFVTSLDMEGIALSVCFLDDELEALWCAPADTASFRKGTFNASDTQKKTYHISARETEIAEASDTARHAACYCQKAFSRIRDIMAEKEQYLAEIDAVAGDGDHGQGMLRGATYAAEAADNAVSLGAGVGTLLQMAGNAWASKAGGTSGVLWGNALMSAGKVIGDKLSVIDANDVLKAFNAAQQRIIELGGAKAGDKTMLDALIPLTETMEQSINNGFALPESWSMAVDAADAAAQATAAMTPRIGRARPQAARSIGTPDAGAISLVICAKAL